VTEQRSRRHRWIVERLRFVIVVPQANRPQGLGRRLVQELSGNAPGITWVLRAERPGARQFFEALGFSASDSAMERARHDPKAAPHRA
jgi:hypothetical protein